MRCLALVLAAGDVERPGNGYLHRVEGPARAFHRVAICGEPLLDHIERGDLVEQQVEVVLRGPAQANGAARSQPQGRVRSLDRRRLDDDVLERPVFADMGKALLRRPGPTDHLEGFLEQFLGIRWLDIEAIELVGPVALADAEF